MRVNVYETIDISEEQRVALARILDGEGAKKRIATRDEIKSYVWSKGEDWALHLRDDADEAEEEDDEDLLGAGSEDDEDDDLEDLI